MPPHRKLIFAVALAGLFFTTGCAMRDFVFSMFESSYTEGGATSSERRWHYERSMDRHESPVGHYDPLNDR